MASINNSFLIISELNSPSELQELLDKEIDEQDSENRKNLELTLKDEPRDVKSVDPVVLAAIFGAGGTLLGTMITLVINSLLKIYEKHKDKENLMIEIVSKNGKKISFPYSATNEEIAKYIDLAASLDQVEHVSVEKK